MIVSPAPLAPQSAAMPRPIPEPISTRTTPVAITSPGPARSPITLLNAASAELARKGFANPHELEQSIITAKTHAQTSLHLMANPTPGDAQEAAIAIVKAGVAKLTTAVATPVDYRTREVNTLTKSAARDFADAISLLQ